MLTMVGAKSTPVTLAPRAVAAREIARTAGDVEQIAACEVAERIKDRGDRLARDLREMIIVGRRFFSPARLLEVLEGGHQVASRADMPRRHRATVMICRFAAITQAPETGAPRGLPGPPASFSVVLNWQLTAYRTARKATGGLASGQWSDRRSAPPQVQWCHMSHGSRTPREGAMDSPDA
jgi:hypothetical protein